MKDKQRIEKFEEALRRERERIGSLESMVTTLQDTTTTLRRTITELHGTTIVPMQRTITALQGTVTALEKRSTLTGERFLTYLMTLPEEDRMQNARRLLVLAETFGLNITVASDIAAMVKRQKDERAALAQRSRDHLAQSEDLLTKGRIVAAQAAADDRLTQTFEARISALLPFQEVADKAETSGASRDDSRAPLASDPPRR